MQIEKQADGYYSHATIAAPLDASQGLFGRYPLFDASHTAQLLSPFACALTNTDIHHHVGTEPPECSDQPSKRWYAIVLGACHSLEEHQSGKPSRLTGNCGRHPGQIDTLGLLSLEAISQPVHEASHPGQVVQAPDNGVSPSGNHAKSGGR